VPERRNDRQKTLASTEDQAFLKKVPNGVKETTMLKKITGKKLMRVWNLPVREARYREDGKWYHHLTDFPAALCDDHGYKIFATEGEYKNCSHLRHTKDLHVDEGINMVLGYTQAPFPASVLLGRADSGAGSIMKNRRAV
jgi:hypothetical protein